MRNYDRIKAMTIEEVATLLSCAWHKADYEDGDYNPQFFKWLQEKEKEGQHEI